VDLPDRYNVGADLIERNLPARAAKIAIHSASGDITYADLFQLTNGAARALLDLGVRREERVLLVGYDSPRFASAQSPSPSTPSSSAARTTTTTSMTPWPG